MINILKNTGYSLIELLAVIVIVSILAGVAVKSLRSANETAKTERTKEELDQLAYAVAGDPNLTSGGTRTDFGYVGDIGSMPPNLDALVSNPGSFATWNGPYLHDDYLPAPGSGNSEFKVDDWGATYNYSGGNTISSTGSGTTISRQLANSVSDLVLNSVAVTVTDIKQTPPGSTYRDSVLIVLTHPNGAGGTVTRSRFPANDGFVRIDSVPIGRHTLTVIYTPQNDTLNRKVTVNPGQLANVDVNLFRSFGGTTPPIGSPTFIIRPNGPGSYNEIVRNGCIVSWQCVDDVISDGDASYVESILGPWSTDTYALEDPVPTGNIDSIIVKCLVKNTSSGQIGRTEIVVNGNLYSGTNTNLNSYSTYDVISTTYVTNPETSSPWTWTDLNNLQAGVGIKDPGRCTQVWVEIYHTP